MDMEMEMKIHDQPLLSLNDVREVIKQHNKQEAKRWLFNAAARFMGRKEWEHKLKHKLESTIPKEPKCRVLRKMARLFDNEKIVNNYQLVQCFIPTMRGNNRRLRKFSEKDYKSRKSDHKDDEKLKNRFKMLNKFWKNIGYATRFGKYQSKIVLIKLMVGSDKNELDITTKIV